MLQPRHEAAPAWGQQRTGRGLGIPLHGAAIVANAVRPVPTGAGWPGHHGRLPPCRRPRCL